MTTDTPLVAIVGAGGFIGARLTEWLTLTGRASVRTVTRSHRAAVPVSRLATDACIADALDEKALCEAFLGSSIVFDCVLGTPQTNVKIAEAIHNAAVAAGVRRLVRLSTAAVHGTPVPRATIESSPMTSDKYPAYNLSKAKAEERIRELGRSGRLEVVTLRPSVVYGPRSWWWTQRVAMQLRAGTAYLVEGGSGLTNSVYIDDLVSSLWLAAAATEAAGQDFLIAGHGQVTWAAFYAAIAKEIDADMASIRTIPADAARRGSRHARRSGPRTALRRSASTVAAWIPTEAKGQPAYRAVKHAVDRVTGVGTDHLTEGNVRTHLDPVADVEIAAMQLCEWPLPTEKSSKMLDYQPSIDLAGAMERTGPWLRWVLDR